MLFDFAARQWEDLVSVDIGPFRSSADDFNTHWSHDSRFVHFHNRWTDGELFRIRVDDRRVESLGTLRNERWTWGGGGMWVGLTPDDSLLYLRDQSIHHVYALDWEW